MGHRCKELGGLNTAINAEDAQAGDVAYHISCYTQLKTDARSAQRKANTKPATQEYDPLVIAQLVTFMEHNKSSYTIAELCTMYEKRLKQVESAWLGGYIHATRFRSHLEEKLGPDWTSFSKGRDIYLSHKKTVGKVLSETCTLQVSEDEAKKIVEVGILLRKYTLLQQTPFTGSFTTACLSEPVAKPLLTLLDSGST